MEKKPYSVKETFGQFLPNVTLPEAWTVSGYANKTENVPKVDPHYLFDLGLFRDLLNWWELHWQAGVTDGLLLFGPPGCGKTAGLTQLAALLNIPLYEKTAYGRMRFEELVARSQILAGSSFVQYGQLSKAMGAEGMPGILLLNEADHAQEGVLTGMNEVLQGGLLDVLGQEVLVPKDGFRVAFTSNTGFLGDTSGGNFRGARRQNIANVDRCMQVKLSYADPATELAILARKVPEIPEQIAKGMIEVANDVRAAFLGSHAKMDAIEVTISTRGLIRWAILTVAYKDAEKSGISPISYALERAVLSVASAETQQAVLKIVDDKFGGDAMLGAKGKKAAA